MRDNTIHYESYMKSKCKFIDITIKRAKVNGRYRIFPSNHDEAAGTMPHVSNPLNFALQDTHVYFH